MTKEFKPTIAIYGHYFETIIKILDKILKELKNE